MIYIAKRISMSQILIWFYDVLFVYYGLDIAFNVYIFWLTKIFTIYARIIK